MTPTPAPPLDDRDEAAVLADLLARLPSYIPGWSVPDSGPSRALAQVAARYAAVVSGLLNRAPDKNLLAFLDQAGESLVEARAARVPVVFRFQPPAPPPPPAVPSGALAALNLPPPPPAIPLPVLNIRVPARTKVATAAAGGGAPVVFETERAFALLAANLARVVSLWPGRDTYEDHSGALAAGTPFTLFTSTDVTPHALYLAHDAYFQLQGKCTVELAFDLIEPSSARLNVSWEYWDGQGWHPFGDPELVPATGATPAPGDPAPGGVDDGTDGFRRSGVVTLSGDCVDTARTAVDGAQAFWLRGRLIDPLPPDAGRRDPLVGRVKVDTVVQRLFDPRGLDAYGTTDQLLALLKNDPKLGLKPDQALGEGMSLDLSKAFYPLGQSPQPGSTFAFSSEEIFSKPGAVVRVALNQIAGPMGDASRIDVSAQIAWESWDGSSWVALRSSAVGPTLGIDGVDFSASGVYGFLVPDEGIPTSTLGGKDGRWVRARVDLGDYTSTQPIPFKDSAGKSQELDIVTTVPPLLSEFRLAYVYRSPRAFPERCLSYNDFVYEDHGDDVRWPGAGFAAFRSVSDATPALYLGFDRPLPVDDVSLFAAVEEQEGGPPGPTLTWEYWDGLAWSELAVADDTANLVRPGMVSFIGPADAAPLPRFGAPLTWVRARLREDGTPAPSTVDAIALNAVWASQSETVVNEVLGSGTGEPSPAYFAARNPVLDGERLEVRELDGRRAAVELPVLAQGVDPVDLNVVSDARGVVREVWVRWHGRPNFDDSGPGDRDYVLERSQGRVVFGDGVNGRLLPAGTDNVVLRAYRTGGGVAGNVPAEAVAQLLGGIPYVSGVTNPRAAEGGADGETLDQVRVRGPQVLRHRGRALAARDYESLAREASPAVAVARALPATDPGGRPAPGRVKVVIVPRSQDPRPEPTFELRRQVTAYLQDRMPAATAGVYVTGPSYLPVGVAVVVAPLDPTEAGPVGVAVRQALEAFLHPLTGGPGGRGWPFGRGVAVSDVAAALEPVAGVDSVRDLELLLDGVAQGDSVDVPPDRIVVAGTLKIRLAAP